jgi:hypothetical protein
MQAAGLAINGNGWSPVEEKRIVQEPISNAQNHDRNDPDRDTGDQSRLSALTLLARQMFFC